MSSTTSYAPLRVINKHLARFKGRRPLLLLDCYEVVHEGNEKVYSLPCTLQLKNQTSMAYPTLYTHIIFPESLTLITSFLKSVSTFMMSVLNCAIEEAQVMMVSDMECAMLASLTWTGASSSNTNASELQPIFFWLRNPYRDPPVDWNTYSEFNHALIDDVVNNLLVYDNLYWTIQIEIASMWEERLGGEGFDETSIWNEHMHK